ncbi:response regulator [Camelliibacillus cellulosilyticus]|uniref:Response regulator n=1 Tax=Camelliibacillus cellulosilyticus TaxID=2174486 RepID=A0ABV9GN15_9BACL
MERMKALLIDDEVNLLKNLRTVIPWDLLGIDIVGMATNGREALDIYREHKPELILCDIRMPIMDGIEFVKKAAQEGDLNGVIMLTGHKDFEYMQSSIRSGVRDYLLKPIDYDELRDVVEKIASEIRMTQLKAAMEKKKWGTITNLAYEKNLHDALMGYTASLMQMKDTGKGRDGQVYQLFVVDMDHYSQKARFWSEDDRALWHFAVKNVLSEALHIDGGTYAVVQMREGEWCVLIEQHQVKSGQLEAWAKKCQEAIHKYLKLTVSIGTLALPIKIKDLARAYKIIQRDLHLALEKHENQFVLASQTPEKTQSIDYFLWDRVEEIVSGLKKGTSDQSLAALSALKRDLKSVPEESLVHVEQILHFLALHLLREMKDINVIDKQQEEAVWKELKGSIGNDDLALAIQHLVEISTASLLQKKKSEALMIAAKDYIDHHLDRDFGIEDVARYLEISPSYFSALFKQTFHETFLEYVTSARIEKAKTLMATTNLSIAKIAKQLGYSDRRYFSKVFYKYEGLIPSEYRKAKISR